MNKIYLFTAAFAVMASLSGCSDTELASIDTAQEKTPIGFHTVGSQMGSRATIINNGEITKTDFKVYAFTNDGTAFMGNKDDVPGHNGVEINHTTGKWDYASSTDLKYWPGTDKPLNFYAVNPYTFDVDLTPVYCWQINNDKQQISYNCTDEYGKNAGHKNSDVMYAIAKNQTKNNNSGTVNLQFRHILSQIAFQAKTNDPNLVVEINEINLYNMKYSGTFTFPQSANTKPTNADWTPKNIIGKAAGLSLL